MKPSFREEKKLWKKEYKYVTGLDEAGRGPLAGPVVAAAVIVNLKCEAKNTKVKSTLLRVAKSKSKIKKLYNLEVKDSKQLSSKRREELYKILTDHPNIKWGIGRVSEKMIDRINILQATKLAMTRAIQKLNRKPDFLILDGKMKLDLPIPQKSIVKADQKVFSCAAASILAKVTRDRMMVRLHKKYPQYGFDKHKGYPTKFHLKMLKKYRPCKIHRCSYKPVKRNMRK